VLAVQIMVAVEPAVVALMKYVAKAFALGLVLILVIL
jgi:hypothetical protein